MVFFPAGLRIWTTEVVAALTVIWMVLEADCAIVIEEEFLCLLQLSQKSVINS